VAAAAQNTVFGIPCTTAFTAGLADAHLSQHRLSVNQLSSLLLLLLLTAAITKLLLLLLPLT
jgi:hypothetical protein